MFVLELAFGTSPSPESLRESLTHHWSHLLSLTVVSVSLSALLLFKAEAVEDDLDRDP